MIAENPFAEFRSQCEEAIRRALEAEPYRAASIPAVTLDTPPSPRFGQLSSSISFEIAKQLKRPPHEVAEDIVRRIDAAHYPLMERVEAAGGGYINFYAHFPSLSALAIESARALDEQYGYVRSKQPVRVIVEHTSVNPIHPIHIGQARNPVLGDSIARILEARGHQVARHYYIDDMGRQTAIIAYGYERLGRPRPQGKPDHFIGIIYTITSCILEIRRLKGELERAKAVEDWERALRIQRELDDWVSVAAELRERAPQLYDRLLDSINKDEDPEACVSDLIRRYERGEEHAKRLIREVCEHCLEGFRETLSRMGISFDSWDWESVFVWNGDVDRVLERLRRTPYVYRVGGVLEFDAERVAQNHNLKGRLGLREDYEIPSLTLVRANGTTLYTTRDIPYSLWKLGRADKVINVIGMEQSLAQLQLKLALYALGYADQAENLIHFAYNLVRFPGFRMSSRRGRYITLDEVLDEAVSRAYEEVSKRSPHLPEEEKREISNLVGIGAVKYALVEVDPTKPVVFTWDRVLSFERNSSPYIQYSHARACSILRKAARSPERPDYALLREGVERELVLMVARFPEIFVEAAENLKPNLIAEFANALADKFNTFYAALPVVRAEPRELSDARLALVDAVRIVLRNALRLLGIEAPQRM